MRPAFEVAEKSIAELSAALDQGIVTSRDLVDLYFDRIERFDRNGPRLNSMLVINSKAREEADVLDRERRANGSRGPLHGIPIVIKDNFDVVGMPTTGGAVALAGAVPRADAFQIRKLRDAGAVILGKTNMHELAWGITTVSSLGGQTLNPYDPSRNPGGSSGGTGTAVAASFAAFGMGTDTCGSIRYPAAHNNLVGLRATPGLSSRSGILPASHTQDIAGPLARTVEDLAIVLDATVGADPADPITVQSADKMVGSFQSHLDTDGLRGVRVGVLQPLVGTEPEEQPVSRVFSVAIEAMEKLGATSVPVSIPDFESLLQGASVTQREFKFDFNEYLANMPAAPVRTLAEILDGGLYHAAVDRNLRNTNSVASPDTKEYFESVAKRVVVREAILKVIAAEQLDALAYPTFKRTAARIGEAQRGGNCSLSSVSDLPAITVPAGFVPDDGMPVGLELLGRQFSDGNLVKFAYAFAHATRHRRPPAITSPSGTNGSAQIEVRATGSGQVPPINSEGVATVRLDFDASTRRLEYDIAFSGVDAGDVLSVDVHRGAPGARGPIVLVLSSFSIPAASGQVVLSPADASELLAGRLYIDVHTRKHVAGEIRAQLAVR
jgi:Asp-tRNA(Asn)/Glu-tRNA(Gln) amidotransferase A subunit family amidase